MAAASQSAGRTAGQQTTCGASRPARLHHTPVLLPTAPQALVMLRQVTQVGVAAVCARQGAAEIVCVCVSRPSPGNISCHSILLLITIDLVSFYLLLCLCTCPVPVGRGTGETGAWGRCFDRYTDYSPHFCMTCQIEPRVEWDVVTCFFSY